MGVKLQTIIVRKPIDYQDLAGKIIAIDAPNIIMSLFNFSLRDTNNFNTSLILDNTQRPISHLYGLLYRINFFYSKKIFPIFCFDGKISELKRIITKDQIKDFRFTERWYKEAINRGDKDLARQITLSKEYLWPNILLESKQLLGALGVPYIESPASAESQCAYLVKKGYAHFSNSQDFDSILFGCPKTVQHLSKSLRRKVQGRWQYQKIQPKLIDLKKNLNNLKISFFQLVDIGILIGTDYFSGILGIGPKIGLQLIRKYESIERIILKEKNNYEFQKLTPDLLKKMRRIFLFPEVNTSIDDLVWSPLNRSRIIDLFCNEHNLNKQRVTDNLIKYEKNYKNCRSYFLAKNNIMNRKQLTLDSLDFI